MKRIIWALVAAIIVAVIPASPAMASVPQPDTSPSVIQVDVFRNLRETGDMLYVIYANIPYATIPDIPVDEAYWWELQSSETTLGGTTGYAYNSYGYGYNVYSMYFSADDVADLGMVWGTPYELMLNQSPSQFETPTYFTFNINAGDYTSYSESAENRAALSARILELANHLDNDWGLSSTHSLLSETDTGSALSVYGSAFFRGAIFGLQSMAPDAFSTVIRDIDIDERDWDPEYSDNLSTQWSGTWIDTAKAAGTALFGTDYDLLSIIILTTLCAGLLFANIAVTGDHWNGLIDVAFLAVIGARLGMYDMAFLILIAALCWFYIGTKIWFRVMQ